jgi:hypothetical protein
MRSITLGVNWRATLGDYNPQSHANNFGGEIVNKYDLEEYGDMMKGALRCLETNPPYQRRYNYEGAIRYLIAGNILFEQGILGMMQNLPLFRMVI